MTNSKLGYLGLRLAFGLSILMHGAVRFPKYAVWAQKMSGQFDETLLAGFPSLSFAYLIPLIEFSVGLGILAGGRAVRWAAFAGCLLMGGIMFGTCVLEKWDILPSQLIHLAFFYAILNHPLTADVLKPAETLNP